jgi:RNA polymerase sigma-B factor
MSLRAEESRVADRLWAEYARTHDPRTRDALVHQFERLASSIANRFARCGTDNEDLFQVALLGLVKAVNRFDPATHYRFATFATPTILGEIKRYFRNHSRPVHVPRGMQEPVQQVARVDKHLTERLGRTATAAELGADLEVPEERVRKAPGQAELNHPSLDREMLLADGDRASSVEQTLGQGDGELEHAEHEVSVRQALGHLSEPLQQVIQMRYLNELSQREVARRLGLSQMQVSRLEKRALGELGAQFAVN